MEKRKKGLKKSRRALLASCLSVVLCAALLVGATFALFTDTEEANVQLITIGNLDVCLVEKDKSTEITSSTVLEFNDYENETAAVVYGGEELVLEEFYVKNKSDVAVTYTIAVTAPSDAAKDAVTSYSVTVDGESYTLADTSPNTAAATSITVEAADSETGYTLGKAIVLTADIDSSEKISDYMGEDVGNFVITVTITQATNDDSSDESTTE